MQNYITKDKEIFIGLEDAKRTWKVSVRSQGMEIHFTSMPAQYGVLIQFLKTRFPGCTIALIYEAGFRGFELHDRLAADGIKCVVTPPSRVTYERRRRRKNDKIDARRLATILETNDFKACFVPDRERREDRQISRTLVGLQKDITRTRNRIRKFFDFNGLAENFRPGEWSEGDYERARELEMSPTLRSSLGSLYELLDHLKEIDKRLRSELKQMTQKARYQRAFELLKSAPGVGWLTAIRLVLEWGEDWSRFTTFKSISCFSGLISSEYSTGETDHKGRITGESAPFVRAWLIQCAWTAIRKDPVLLSKFQQVWKNSGSKKKAIVAVARKLIVRLRGLMINDTPYCLGVVR